jgi:hypothetical protein
MIFSRSKRESRAKAATFVSMLLALVMCTTLIGSLSSTRNVEASDPSSGTLNPTDAASLTWTGTATAGGALNAPGVDPVPGIGNEELCKEGENCDTFTLTLSGTNEDWAGKFAHIEINWTAPTTDYDLYIHQGSLSGPIVANSGRGATSPTGPLTREDVNLDVEAVGTGVFAVHVVYYAATSADQYRGSAAVTQKPAPPPAEPPAPAPPVSNEQAPIYAIHAAPAPLGRRSGEPSIGTNWKTGKTMFKALFDTMRVSFDDSTLPSKATWLDKSPTAEAASLDPILFTDSVTGRTFSSLLLGKTSSMSYTDDDGETWIPTQGSGINSGVDHQTIGGGPYARDAAGNPKGFAVPLPLYPHAVYYASQDIGAAQLARSDDGGLTFGPAVPMYNATECGGLHGHVKVGPDGTIYIPNKWCDNFAPINTYSTQAVLVSEDNGLTWTRRLVPGTKAGRTDPSVAVGSDGTVYFAYANGDGLMRVTVSRDKGATWTDDQDLGYYFGVRNAVFPAAVAGDGDRAAVFFLGTTVPGAAGQGTDTSFPGEWHAYMATTYDRGKTWKTVDVTPHDAVQRGVVCTNGTTCPGATRNLLDFNDLQVDKQGRVLAAFADGCTTAACIAGTDKNGDGRLDSNDNDGTALATIIRQEYGKGLFAAYDAIGSLTLSPAAIYGGQTSAGTVTLGAPAPAGGAVVQLYSSDAAATVPATVTIPEGATSGAFSVTTKPVTANKSVAVTAFYKGQKKWALLAVNSRRKK